jgi:hypothetical protein
MMRKDYCDRCKAEYDAIAWNQRWGMMQTPSKPLIARIRIHNHNFTLDLCPCCEMKLNSLMINFFGLEEDRKEDEDINEEK